MTEFVEVKAADLVGSALDYATGIAVGAFEEGEFKFRAFNPSTDWGHGGPLIEKYHVDLHYPHGLPGRGWWAQAGTHSQENPFAAIDATPLVAACRAIVASVLGETVSVPKELLS